MRHSSRIGCSMSDGSEFGIETSYRDGLGATRAVATATVARLIAALTCVTPDGAAIAAEALGDGARCFRPNWMATERVWGVSAQLYGIRSTRNWGVGDFTDLRQLVALAAAAGAEFVGVSPLHALYAAAPWRFSPYSPSSREFLNVLFIDATAMRAYAIAPGARQAAEAASFQKHLVELRDADLVDYARVAACKEAVFRLVFDGFGTLVERQPNHPLAVDFARFRRERGEPLQRFSLYQALSCRPGFGPNWMAWPENFHDPAGASVREFAAANERDVRYHAFLQWEADAQLAACAAATRSAGMKIGLYLDLAVGTDPGSAEAWSERHKLIPGFHIGAPPDAWNAAGQDWGLSAYNPQVLAREGCGEYRRVLAAAMRHAGAVRIDHVLGFHRLFLVPAGGTPTDGAYLGMPAPLLCSVLAEESLAARCLVIGEDLGTVPEGFHALLGRYGILSYRLLMFAKDGSRFLAPSEYPADALVAFATHDLPPVLAFWSGSDIALRAAHGVFSDEAKQRLALAERAADRQAMQAAFAAGDDPVELMVATYRFLARTPCRLLLVQMEDLAMEYAQPNLPGDERHPNWRRKLGRCLREIFADERAALMLATIRDERP